MLLGSDAPKAPDDLSEVLRLSFEDPVFFCKFFLRHWFPDRIPWFHRGIMAIVTRQADFLLKYGDCEKIARHFLWKDDNEVLHPIFHFTYDALGLPVSVKMTITRHNNIIVPRGFSKTTLLNALNLRSILLGFRKFIMYLSESGPHAKNQIITLRREFEGNSLLISYFGDMAADRQSARKWTDELLELPNGSFIAGIGRGGQIRGRAISAIRPDQIVVDDVEDEESVRSPTQLKHTRDWFFQAVVPALPKRSKEASITCLGTLLGQECLLMSVANDPRFTTMVFGAIDLDGEALWPEHMSLEQIDLEKRAAARNGQLAGFYRETLSILRAEDGNKFKKHHIIIHVPESTRKMPKALMMDPAISEEKSADYCSYGVVGKEDSGHTHVLDIYMAKGMTPREQVDKYFELHRIWDPALAGIETIAYQKALVYLMREEMARTGRYFEIHQVKSHKNNKIDRVEGILQPRYAALMMRHAGDFPLLVEQLLSWPNGKLDGPDVIAMAVALLEPFAGLGAVDVVDDPQDSDYDLEPDFIESCP